MSISIALCTYNGAKYIKEQLESLISQTTPPDEIVVCDDGSDDGTLDIAEKVLHEWGGHYKVLRNEKNLGYQKNFEKSIGACNGEYIFLCDQDDVWLPNKIQKVMHVFQQQPDIGMVFHDAQLVDADLHDFGKRFWGQLPFTELEHPEKYIIYNHGNVVQGCASAIKRELFERAYPFPEDVYHDKWLATVALLTSKLYVLDEPLILYRQHGNNVLGAFGDPNKRKHYGILKHQRILARDNVELLKRKIDFYTQCMKRFYTVYDSHIMNDVHNELLGWQKREQFIKDRNIIALVKLYMNKSLKHYKKCDFRRDLRSVIFDEY